MPTSPTPYPNPQPDRDPRKWALELMNTGDEGAVAAALIYVGDQLNYVINAIDRAR